MDYTIYLVLREQAEEIPGEYDALDIPFRPWVKRPAPVVNARSTFFVSRVMKGQPHGKEKAAQTTA